ncbi:DNA primase [Gemmiger sp. An120]|uniref:DNA primase n=1 Tax=Gemmiger sp. An120 TaxID=1965549 RepID=UPI000B36F5A9|nr:DNA primase [Gemmiger sp. An120]OUQ43503.1 DNA primase [Gemmiger sp. An120]
MIPQEYIQEVVARNDITDVIGSYVQLRHRGRTHTGLCPFHSEKTPSFVVYPETQSYYCFGCGAGGDVITFIRTMNNLGYVEAVKFLAARAGMPLPDEDDKAGKLRSRILEINKQAARFFYQCLNANNEQASAARAYWRRRGLSDGTIRRFGLGWAPDDFRSTLNWLRERGFNEEELLASGLVKRSEKGNLYNIFRGRVMTPIFDLRGNVIAFGGRVLGDEKPKYINSPETPVYKKSRAMFALNLAKKSPSRRYILCEGYMDVISLHQAGFDTAVAACGTALTGEQVKLLENYADEVVLCYDSDEAGQKATARSLELFSHSPIKVSVLTVTGAKDPDEFIKKFGKNRFEMLLNGTHNALEYKLGKLKDNYDLATDAGRVGYIQDAIRLLTGHITPTEREVYAGRLAQETNVSKASIQSQLDAALRQADRREDRRRQKELLNQGTAAQIKVPYSLGGEKALGIANAEQQLLAAMLKNADFIPLVRSRIQPDKLLLPDMQQACQAVFNCYDRGVTAELATLAPEVTPETLSLLSAILARNHDVAITRQDVEMYLDRIEQSFPKSAQAAQMSPEELEAYIRSLRDKKMKK